MRILLLAGVICLMSTMSTAAEHKPTSGIEHVVRSSDYCGVIANDMAIAYIKMLEWIRKRSPQSTAAVNASITFQGLAKSYELAECDPARWRGKIIEIEQELRLGD